MPPEDVRCAALTSQSLQVSWQPPPTEHCNGLLQGYKLTYEPVLDDNWKGNFHNHFKLGLFFNLNFWNIMTIFYFNDYLNHRLPIRCES